MAVTGTSLPFASQTWVMPSLMPSTPFEVLVAVMVFSPLAAVSGSELDLDVDVGRQVEAHERVDRVRSRVDDVVQPLVRALLEVLAAVLVLVGRTDHGDHVLLRRERHGADHAGAGTGDRVDDLASGRVDDLVVVRLQPDADLLSRHGSRLPSPGYWVQRPGRGRPRPAHFQ